MIKYTVPSLTTLAIVAFLGASSPAGAWQPPLGIPVPPFGITDVQAALPSAWTSAVSGFYYVDYQIGTDSNNPNGWPANPRQTIPFGAGTHLPAGAVVVVSNRYDGTHTSPNGLYFDGTAAKPIFITGVGAAIPPTFTKPLEFLGSYFVFEHVTVKHDTAVKPTIMIRDGSDHYVLRHNDISGNLNGGGIASGDGSTLAPNSYGVFWDNTIHDFGAWTTPNFDKMHGVGIGGTSHDHIWIVDNTFFHCEGDAWQIITGAAGPVTQHHHIYAGRNLSYDNQQTGGWSKRASDVIFSQNTVHGSRSRGAPVSVPGDCMGAQYGPNYIWFIFNHLYDCVYGIRLGSDGGDGNDGTEQFFIGNLIHDHVTDAGTGISLWGGTNRYVVNNTIWGNKQGVDSPFAGVTGPVHLINNIIGGRTVPANFDIQLMNATSAGASDMKNNLVNGSPEAIDWANGGIAQTLAQFQASTRKGQNSTAAAPVFVNPSGTPATKDFHEGLGSPSIDAGLTDPRGVFTTFFNRYGIDIAKDIDGTTRPQGLNYDLGAYESGSQTVPPAAPATLQVR